MVKKKLVRFAHSMLVELELIPTTYMVTYALYPLTKRQDKLNTMGIMHYTYARTTIVRMHDRPRGHFKPFAWRRCRAVPYGRVVGLV
jgi:hypothetical protein